MHNLNITLILDNGKAYRGEVTIAKPTRQWLSDEAIEYFIEETWIDGSTIVDIEIHRSTPAKGKEKKFIVPDTHLSDDQQKYGKDYHPFNRCPLEIILDK